MGREEACTNHDTVTLKVRQAIFLLPGGEFRAQLWLCGGGGGGVCVGTMVGVIGGGEGRKGLALETIQRLVVVVVVV